MASTVILKMDTAFDQIRYVDVGRISAEILNDGVPKNKVYVMFQLTERGEPAEHDPKKICSLLREFAGRIENEVGQEK